MTPEPAVGVVAVTGAAGYVASNLLPRLVHLGWTCRAIVRPRHDVHELERLAPEVRRADLGDESPSDLFEGADAVVHLAGLGLVPSMVSALERARVKRAVFVGSAGVHTRLRSRGAEEKRAGERALRESGIDYVILRPSMIYGTPGDRNVARLLRWLERMPLLPLPGGGRTPQQPVHVEDLCEAILASLTRPEAVRKTYDVGGPQAVPLSQLVRACAAAMGRPVWPVHIPLGPSYAAARVARALRLPVPVRPEQVLRLQESKAVDIEPARHDLGFTPRTFEEGVRAEAALLRGHSTG